MKGGAVGVSALRVASDGCEPLINGASHKSWGGSDKIHAVSLPPRNYKNEIASIIYSPAPAVRAGVD